MMPQNENSSLLYTQVEKAMATHSSTLAWKIPWMEKPGRLQSMGLIRVGHDWAISLSFFTFMHWRRTWQPTPVFFPGGSQGRGSLVGHHLWGSRVRHDWSDLAAAAAAAYTQDFADFRTGSQSREISHFCLCSELSVSPLDHYHSF